MTMDASKARTLDTFGRPARRGAGPAVRGGEEKRCSMWPPCEAVPHLQRIVLDSNGTLLAIDGVLIDGATGRHVQFVQVLQDH